MRSASMRPTAGTVANLLDKPLVMVDVGCRWGFPPVWENLGPRCRLIGFDPDKEECVRLQRRYRRNSHVRIIAEALGAQRETATMYLTAFSAGNSLLPTPPDVIDAHPDIAGGRMVGTSTVEVRTLDEWCASNGLDGVDFIKIDTQGSELAVLEGALEMLHTTRALEMEVHFNPLYVGMPLFGEIDRFMREHAFELWRCRDFVHYPLDGAPLGLTTIESVRFGNHSTATIQAESGQLFWCNAFYVHRDVARPRPELGWAQLVRDACITSALEFFDLTVLALEHARQTAPPNIRLEIDMLLTGCGLEPTP